ncbi:hypothetical protein NE237_019273 [Protea cynaroides]|uniref:Uncharacterized protein n=1 Tax=Protea cynaroides TaxID=273540 RepID=A0A9Q0QPY2_9MAGN|nr:hypothetical protein NE237_019273 [Protea cynaroides]
MFRLFLKQLSLIQFTEPEPIDPFSIIPKKDCWQQVETFLWPPSKGNAGRVELGRGFENRVGSSALMSRCCYGFTRWRYLGKENGLRRFKSEVRAQKLTCDCLIALLEE